MNDRPRFEERFELFVADLFRQEGFAVEPGYKSGREIPDLIVTSKSGRTAVVEIKLYRSSAISADIILRIVNQVESFRRDLQIDRAVFVTLAQVPIAYIRALMRENPRLVVYDYWSLKFSSSKHPRLAAELESIARDAILVTEHAPSPDVFPIDMTLLDADPPALEKLVVEEPPPAKGAWLCQEVLQIKSGKSRAGDFEKAVEAALRYIFETDLVAWSSQNVTDGGLSRHDLIARISSSHDMWRMLVERFNSQYVIFEFKNYGGRITQGEIYTTEKYLFAKAMRTTAIIVSRKGADKNALAACRGALREHGKLIINLSVDDICKLLALRDADDDCNAYLFQIVDDMLMKLER
jgi:hypothetical protein